DEIEFLERIKVIALYFNNLTDIELISLKHWIRNTVQDKLAEPAIEILESKKEDVERMVANNAFILTEMKEKAVQEGIEKGIQKGEMKKAIEIAKSLLDVLDTTTIAIKTGLTIEEVEKLKLEI
ncbi:MAG: hypothetical protein ACRC03_17515, partial [Romboutsia sp.]